MDKTNFELDLAHRVRWWLVFTYVSGFGAGWLVCLFTH
jgi:hypothetical protein